MPDILTERQKEVLNFIRLYIEKEGISPTVREIAAHFGFSSPLSVQLHINALVKKGYLTKTPLKTRNIKVIGLNAAAGRSIPVIGMVRAGRPLLALEEAGTYITVDRNLFKNREAFALRIKGDSMVDAGIFDGDLVIVKPEKDPLNGSISVVLIGDEVTVKRLYKEDGHVRLVPENRALNAIVADLRDVQIIGRVIGVIRKL